ncbi:MAG: cytochrome c biogenesis protein ResB [Cyanobacteria bacterium P01_H01_bin.15]
MQRGIKFIGSIQLAVPLLCIIGSILIWATFYEAEVGTATVQRLVYKSPWFGALMFCLALNLGFSAMSRYPWRGARKIGFALTHLGLIILIASSAAVIHLGLEGMLLVREQQGAQNQIRVEGELLEILQADGELLQADLFVNGEGEIVPDTVGKFNLSDYQANTIKTTTFNNDARVENPAVQIQLKSERMGQSVERWLAFSPPSYAQTTLGPAELSFVMAQNKADLDRELVLPSIGTSQGVGDLQLVWGEQVQTLQLDSTFPQSFDIGQDRRLTALEFWSDFRLDADGQPASASTQFNNPALLLEASTPAGRERWFLFGEGFEAVRKVVNGERISDLNLKLTVTPPPADAYFHVIADPQGDLFYAAKSSQNFESGPLNIGDTITPGWADFQIEVIDVLDHAQVERKITVADPQEFAGVPALKLESPELSPTWLSWGEATEISTPSGSLFAVFSPKVVELPFAIALEDFIVERNEGSESVAMWTSQIRIEDPAHTVSEERKVWMNHPTWYRGWKIAQASWNPGDLSQSTLQVKREPAWVTSLTWLGSALVIGGIAVMFYGRALSKKLQRALTVSSDEGEMIDAPALQASPNS